MKVISQLMMLSAGYNALMIGWWMWAGQPSVSLWHILQFCFPWIVVAAFVAVLAYEAANK